MREKKSLIVCLLIFVLSFWAQMVFAESGDPRDALEQFFSQDHRSELEKISTTPETMRAYIDQQKNVGRRYEGGKTLLHQAAMRNYGTLVRLLLERGADINAADHDLRTPLHEAMSYFAVDAVAILIQSGADMNRRDKEGGLPLDSIVFWDDEEKALRAADLFIRHGFRLNKSATARLLNEAIGRRRERLACLLVQNGIPFNRASLAYAVREGYDKLFDRLLEKGADAKQSITFGDVCRGGSVPIGRKLASLGVVPSADEIDTCVFNGGKELAEFLNQILVEQKKPAVDLKRRCRLKPDGGVCKANFIHAYYDGRVCREFSYGGCGGEVPFDSLEACRSFCEE
ncbi:MAG TPA: ankyrin repeat domain-containing protein [Smithella sp.]|nr:ankyrin repeat domain-containing protein [Smithella sp.]